MAMGIASARGSAAARHSAVQRGLATILCVTTASRASDGVRDGVTGVEVRPCDADLGGRTVRVQGTDASS